MSIKQFTIGFSRTINLGNYESARVEAQVTMEMDEHNTFDEAVAGAQIELRHLLVQTWKDQSATMKNGTKQ